MRYKTPQQTRSERSMGYLSPPAPIVGRQQELTLLMHHYEAARGGHVHVALLAGEPGIGKTRLLDEIALQTARNGATVLRGHASEAEGMPPFLPFLEALGRYVRATPHGQLQAQLSAVPQMLANLLPELAIYLPDLLASPLVPPEQARLRLFEAFRTFLEAISESHPLVLTLDNLHWADTASLDLLRHLTHYQLHVQLFILGAYRENEVDQNLALARTLTELSRQRVLTTIAVNPLSAVEIGMLASGRYGNTLSPAVNTFLHAQSEGNPFFAEELLDGWIESGTLHLEHQQWTEIAPREHTLPPTIAGAIRQRFAHLAPAIIDHLRVAAIIGRSFDLTLLATVEGQESEVIEECLLEVVRARLLQIDQQGCYTFSHDKIRECLYTEVSTSRRRRLHGLIGHVLEANTGQEHPMGVYQLANLAFHFSRSGDRARGVHYSLLAAVQALHTSASEEAIAYYRIALELLSQDDRRRGAILLDLGKTALLAGKDQEAETIYQAAQHWLLQFDKQDNGTSLARAAHGLGLALWRQEKRQEAFEAFEHALAFFGSGECAEKVKILLDLAQLLMIYMGKHDEGLAHAQQALEIAHNLGETELETIARRINVENLSIHGSDLSCAVQFLEILLAQVEERGDLAEAGECCLNLAVSYYWLARVKQSYAVSLHRITLIERLRDPYHLRTAYTWPIVLLASQGKWTEAKRQIALARPVVEHLASQMPFAFLHQFQGFLAYQQEQYSLAEYELQAATALVNQNLQGGLGEIMFYSGLQTLIQATLGKRAEAQISMAHVERILEILPDGILPTAPMRVCLALSAIALGDNVYAKNLYTPLQAFRGQHYWFLVDRILGLLATLKGEWEDAEIHLEEAEVIARREGLQPELARTLLGQADLALNQGGHETTAQAIRLLNQALLLFETLGMEDSASRTRQRLQALAHNPPFSHDSHVSNGAFHSSLPSGLTTREVAVLRLVTCGKSNSQIAQELVISEKTVINHLTHIFNKTNSENRAAATAFAIRHGLA